MRRNNNKNGGNAREREKILLDFHGFVCQAQNEHCCRSIFVFFNNWTLIINVNIYADKTLLKIYFQDTRTHVVDELFQTEKSYVESLQTIVMVSDGREFHATDFLWQNLFSEIFESLEITWKLSSCGSSDCWWNFLHGSLNSSHSREVSGRT